MTTDTYVCAECGTADAPTWVVTFTDGHRTEVCRTCDNELQTADHAARFHAAYYRAETDAPACHDCGDRRTVYCNGDGFGYCVDHYPRGTL